MRMACRGVMNKKAWEDNCEFQPSARPAQKPAGHGSGYGGNIKMLSCRDGNGWNPGLMHSGGYRCQHTEGRKLLEIFDEFR